MKEGMREEMRGDVGGVGACKERMSVGGEGMKPVRKKE